MAGFADPQTKEGRLWVLDSLSGNQWASSPRNTAYERDFYRATTDDPNSENFVETLLSQVESETAHVIRSVRDDRTLPGGDDLDSLIGFVALMLTRVPWFRASVSQAFVEIARHVVDLMTATPEHWNTALDQAKESGFDPGLSREEMREVLDTDKYGISLSQNYSLGVMLRMTERIYPVVRARRWSLVINEHGETNPLITSDCPASLVSTEDVPAYWGPGLAMRSTLLMLPLDDELCLFGTFEDAPSSRSIDENEVAQINAATAVGCTRFVYSRDEDFYWRELQGSIGSKHSFVDYVKEAKAGQEDPD